MFQSGIHNQLTGTNQINILNAKQITPENVLSKLISKIMTKIHYLSSYLCGRIMNMRKNAKNNFINNCENGPLKNYYKTILNFLENRVDYAYLMTGDWGSGKTHFCKNSLSEYLSKKGYNVLVVSLYGKSSIDEINWELFYKHDLKGNKKPNENGVKKTIEKTASSSNDSTALVGHLLSMAYEQSKKAICKKVTSERFLKKLLIVFDDLERCNESIRDQLLGNINSLFIENGAHVLLIADEKKISEQKDKLFFERKEKIIRSTFHFEFPCLKDALESLMGDENRPIRELYNSTNKSFLSFIEKVNKIKNLRTWATVFDYYDQITRRCEYSPNNPYQLQLFGIILLTTHYYKTDKDLFDTPSISINENEKTLEREIQSCFGINYTYGIYGSYHFRLLANQPGTVLFSRLKSLITFIESGYLDEKELMDEFEKIYPCKNKANKAKIRLYDYHSLSIEELGDCLKTILEGVDEHSFGFEELIGIGKLLHSFEEMEYISLYGNQFSNYKLRITNALSSYSDSEVASFYKDNDLEGCHYKRYLNNNKDNYMNNILESISVRFNKEEKTKQHFTSVFNKLGDYLYLEEIDSKVRDRMIKQACDYELFSCLKTYRCIDITMLSTYIHYISNASNCGEIQQYYDEVLYLTKLKEFISQQLIDDNSLGKKQKLEFKNLILDIDSAIDKLESTRPKQQGS